MPVASDFLHQGKAFLPAKLPRQFAPERADRLLAVFPRLTWSVGSTVQNGNAGLRHIHQSGLIDQRRNAGQIPKGHLRVAR